MPARRRRRAHGYDLGYDVGYAQAHGASAAAVSDAPLPQALLLITLTTPGRTVRQARSGMRAAHAKGQARTEQAARSAPSLPGVGAQPGARLLPAHAEEERAWQRLLIQGLVRSAAAGLAARSSSAVSQAVPCARRRRGLPPGLALARALPVHSSPGWRALRGASSVVLCPTVSYPLYAAAHTHMPGPVLTRACKHAWQLRLALAARERRLAGAPASHRPPRAARPRRPARVARPAAPRPPGARRRTAGWAPEIRVRV